jgi:hypothetical protein
MKISIECYGRKYITETDNDDLIIEDYMDIINNMLLSISFHQDTIIEGVEEFVKEKKGL